MVSTSSCCVVTNEMVLCLGNLCTINHDERTASYWLSSMFYYVCYHSPKLYHISELHNNSLLYNSSVFQYYIVHKSNNIQFIGSQVSLIYLNGASLQDNSLLRYTLYTSSVQDLHHPLKFLLQRQSYAFYQGNTLELSVSYD